MVNIPHKDLISITKSHYHENSFVHSVDDFGNFSMLDRIFIKLVWFMKDLSISSWYSQINKNVPYVQAI